MAWNPNVPTVTNRVQDDLNAIRENFKHLDPLAPYITALVSSRVVDHNLDVPNPPNGYYARWDNGLQICWHILEGVNTDPENAGWHEEEGFVEWTIPASFVDEILVLAFASSPGWHPQRITEMLDTDTATIRGDLTLPLRYIPYRVLVYQNRRIFVRGFAVGRWK